ncbi:tyrosine-type recombinase/integrase [Streptomyces sp. NPDC058459]|uniref:tyrosine-type recombinase/integrase n=1 Tax=Streptomyces sp. NPDC058459 TaxID=3346508 RepID=UPI0036633275
MSTSALSVVIRAFNEAAYLPRYLPSVIASLTRWEEITGRTGEVIVVDNASTDATADMASSFGVRIVTESVAKQLVVDGWEVYEDDPKTDAGARTIALDSDTVQALRRHRAQQDKDREEWESAWVETGRVFTKENGELLHPANVTRRFIELYEEIGLPPVRLHDLRHGAATLAHAAGADLKDIQEMLGHSSITITADTYTSLLSEADLAIAEAAARLVPRARATSENTASEAAEEPDDPKHPDPESVPDDADPLGGIREIHSPSAHAPLTQTAPDEESEAE